MRRVEPVPSSRADVFGVGRGRCTCSTSSIIVPCTLSPAACPAAALPPSHIAPRSTPPQTSARMPIPQVEGEKSYLVERWSLNGEDRLHILGAHAD